MVRGHSGKTFRQSTCVQMVSSSQIEMVRGMSKSTDLIKVSTYMKTYKQMEGDLHVRPRKKKSRLRFLPQPATRDGGRKNHERARCERETWLEKSSPNLSYTYRDGLKSGPVLLSKSQAEQGRKLT